MAIKILKLTKNAKVAAGHGRLSGSSVELTGEGYIMQSERGNTFIVFKTTDGVDLWLNTFTKLRRNQNGEDVAIPNDPFLQAMFNAANVGTAEGQIDGFIEGLKAIGFAANTLQAFKKGLFEEGTPKPLSLKWLRIGVDGTTYYSVEKA